MKLTIGILTCTLDESYKKMTDECIESFRPYADELIVVEAGNEYKYESDVYIKFNGSCGYTRGVNSILRNAKGDYILFVSNDTRLISGDPHDFCIENTVTSPNVFPAMRSGFSGVMFCIPRIILDKYGYLDEGMIQRYSDTEYGERLVKNKVKIKVVDSVEIFHKLDQTSHKYNDLAENDRQYYENKCTND